MPCDMGMGGGPSWGEVHRLERELRELRGQIEPALCAALTFITQKGGLAAFLSETNWQEAGITPEVVVKWWVEHQAQDKSRKAAGR